MNAILANMQVSLKKYEKLVRAFAPSGNLFFLLTLGELRRQGLTFSAFYVLQRSVEKQISEHRLRCETGLPSYEISRACRFLEKSGLVEITKSDQDARIRLVNATAKGGRIHSRVLNAAARQLENGVPEGGRPRRLSEATDLFRNANRVLQGPVQLTFFDFGLLEEKPGQGRKRGPLRPG